MNERRKRKERVGVGGGGGGQNEGQPPYGHRLKGRRIWGN